MRVLSGNNLPRAKVSNQAAIKDIVYHFGPIYRGEIANLLSLTLPTITTTTNVLLSKGLLKQLPFSETEKKNVGRRANPIDIAEDSRLFLGLEIRGSGRYACVTDFRGNVLFSEKDSSFYSDYDECIHAATDLVKGMLVRNNMSFDKLSRIGVCLPGVVNEEEGILITHPGYNWSQKPIIADLRRQMNCSIPIHLENNTCARAIAMRYFHQDELKNAENFAYLFVSLGIACPITSNIAGVQNQFFGPGEVGHMVVDPNGPVCSCGNHGCLEVFSSEKAIIQKCAAAISKNRAPKLAEICRDRTNPTMDEILLAQEQQDPAVCSILNEAIFYLGVAVSNIYNFASPHRMVIECTLFTKENNRQHLLEIVQKNIYSLTISDVHFTFVEKTDFSGAMGAVAVAIQNEIFSFTE